MFQHFPTFPIFSEVKSWFPSPFPSKRSQAGGEAISAELETHRAGAGALDAGEKALDQFFS